MFKYIMASKLDDLILELNKLEGEVNISNFNTFRGTTNYISIVHYENKEDINK